jgi:putative phage-type endonuclease
MIIHDVEQRSEEWFRLRLSIPTASEFKRIVTPGGKLSTQCEGYLDELLAEWILGTPLENFSSEWMVRGQELEPQARQAYEFMTDQKVVKIGFVTTDNGLIGCSPDGFVGDKRLLEIKSPSEKVHVGYMRHREVDAEYRPQIQGQLWVCEREAQDVLSYHPRLPAVIVPVVRDEAYIALLAKALDQFTEKMLEAREQLEQHYGPFVRPEPKPEPSEFTDLDPVPEIVSPSEMGTEEWKVWMDKILERRSN